MRKQVDEMIPLMQGARMLGLSYSITHSLAVRGKLDAQQFGKKRWYVSRKSVERFLADRAPRPAA